MGVGGGAGGVDAGEAEERERGEKRWKSARRLRGRHVGGEWSNTVGLL